jgi:thiol-disulfide isomerase/thioredoxin
MPMRPGTPMPEFAGVTEWINGPVEIGALSGHPTLVHFWAVSCHLCHENMPTVSRWREEYSPQGLRVVAVHMPRQGADLDVGRVRLDAEKLGLREPCAIDNAHDIADAFQNVYVPAYFLFDRDGLLRVRAAGQAGLSLIESALERQFS